ncbi:MAG: hypothetical protein OXN17_20350 [Candidatus Poribacteria bacterium]|nr:hypothetical protein [Candidatus Poribacteria bacterium]
MRRETLVREQSIVNSRQVLILVFLLAQLADVAFAVEGKIAFTSNRAGEWAIYVMNGDGGNHYRLTDGGSPAWLPNGKKVGFVHGGDIWVIDREGTNRKNITKGRFKEGIKTPVWSPDGEQIAYRSRVGGIFGITDLYLMDADGRSSRKLTNDLHHDDRPSWSPDGRNIAFSADLRPQENLLESEIFVIDTNGRNRVNLTQNPKAGSTHVSWSPDGSRITYTASPKPLLFHAPHNIHVIDADGTNKVMLTKEDRWAYEWRPAWSPNSKKIAFVKQTPDGFHDIFTINADGGDLRNITQTHRVDEFSPAWSPRPLAVPPSGRMVTRWGEVKLNAEIFRTVR